MKTTTLLKYLTVLSGIAGTLASMKVIPGVSEQTSVSIIGGAAVGFKILDLIENQLSTSNAPVEAFPSKPVVNPPP